MSTARWFTYDGEFTGAGADLPHDAPIPLILDGLVNKSAYQAYSMRRLKLAYAGAAIKVRRSSDNTTLDVGFKTDGTLDTAALLAFTGAGNGFIDTWYDQSGNGHHIVQATAARQPQIVAAGVVKLLQAAPGIDFSAAGNIWLKHSAPGLGTLLASNGFSVSEVHNDVNGTSYAESAQTNAGVVAFNWSSATPPAVRAGIFNGAPFVAGYPEFTSAAVNGVHADLLVKPTGAGASIHRDGLVNVSNAWNPTIPANTGAVMGGIESGANFMSLHYGGKIGEHIVFDGVLDAPSITKLAASQVAYFGI